VHRSHISDDEMIKPQSAVSVCANNRAAQFADGTGQRGITARGSIARRRGEVDPAMDAANRAMVPDSALRRGNGTRNAPRRRESAAKELATLIPRGEKPNAVSVHYSAAETLTRISLASIQKLISRGLSHRRTMRGENPLTYLSAIIDGFDNSVK